MREHQYVVCEGPSEWSVLLDGKPVGCFPTREDAFAAAVAAARQSRAAGHYAWVKFRHRTVVEVD